MKEKTVKFWKTFALIIGILAGSLTLLNYVDDRYLENKYLTIVPTSPGVSLITKRGTDFFEVGDVFGKMVGAVPTGRGTGGGVEAWKIFFDGKPVGCKDIDGYGEWKACYCSDGQRQNKNTVAGCRGFTDAAQCSEVCNPKPLQIVSYPVEKDVHVTGSVWTIEHIGGHNPQDVINQKSFDFMMPVYAPKTVTRYVVQNCQSVNPSGVGYCAGVCEQNICTQKIYVKCQTENEGLEGFCLGECVNNICKVTDIKFKDVECQTENPDLKGYCTGTCEDNLCVIRVTKTRTVFEYVRGGWVWFINIFR